MLVLCWVVDYERLIFFVIHRGVTIEQTPRLLNELNRNHVFFKITCKLQNDMSHRQPKIVSIIKGNTIVIPLNACLPNILDMS